MCNQIAFMQRYDLINWIQKRIADVCRLGSRRMAILAREELGFNVTQHNMLSARRVALDCLQLMAVKEQLSRAPHLTVRGEGRDERRRR